MTSSPISAPSQVYVSTGSQSTIEGSVTSDLLDTRSSDLACLNFAIDVLETSDALEGLGY